MTGGAGRESSLPAPFVSGKRTRPKGREEAEIYAAFYECDCGAKPVVENGHVRVDHQRPCPRHPLNR